MDKTRKKNIKRVISLICIVTIVAVLAAMPLIAKQEPEDNGPKASILSGSVSEGSIRTELIGGGTLAGEEQVTVSVPSAVKLKEFLVSNGDTVTEGTSIATVDRVTVMQAISQVQETLDHLAEQIQEASTVASEENVTALAGGTVKILYAEAGESVQSVMLEHGALAVLSLDGLMAVDLELESSLPVGTAVTVTLSNGTTATGKITKNLMGEMTVTVEDNNYPVDDLVQITTQDGETIGSGKLYIYSPWNATAYAGTVKTVKVKVGDKLAAGKTLLVLSDVGYSAAYRQLVSQRQEYEELMLELFRMYQTQTITAPCDGVVSGIEKNSAQLLSTNGQGYQIVFLANSPNGDDETLYSNFVGKVTAVGQNGWALLMNPQEIKIADYRDLSGVSLEESTMTWVCTYSYNTNTQPEQPTPGEGTEPTPGEGTEPTPGEGTEPAPGEEDQPAPANETLPQGPGEMPGMPQISTDPVYELVDGAWKQISYSSISAGDILLFAVDQEGEFVWLVRVKKASASTPTTPGGTGGFPSGGMTGGYSSGGMTGGYPSGGTQQENTFELYGLDMTQVAAVTPQGEMTLEITVDELDIKALQVGMTAQVKINALGGEKYTATISAIGNTGTNSGGSSKYTVELTMERSGNMLSGMNATATIVLATTGEVLTIPADALVEMGNETVVYTGYDEETETLLNPVTVKTGCSDGETVEILEGLAEGQTYYYAYYDTLEISFTPDFGGGGFMFG